MLKVYKKKLCVPNSSTIMVHVIHQYRGQSSKYSGVCVQLQCMFVWYDELCFNFLCMCNDLLEHLHD